MDTSDRTQLVLACLRGELTHDEIAHRANTTINEVKRWEADFIAGGTKALQAESAPESDMVTELGAINAVNQSLISILNLDELLDQSVEALRMVFGYTCSVALVKGTYIEVCAGYNLSGERLPREGLTFPITANNMIAQTALNRHPVKVPDVQHESPFEPLPFDPGAGSAMAMPLIFKGTVLGVLEARDSRPQAFAARDSSLLETIAFQLAVAIENAQLFNQVYRRVSQLEVLQSVAAQAIEELDVQSVLDYTVQITRQAMGYSLVAVGVLAENPQFVDLTMVSETGGRIITGTARNALQGDSIVATALQTRSQLMVSDVREHGLNGENDSLSPLNPNSRSAMALPIWSKGALFGVITVESDVPNAFDEADIATITTLADQLVIAITGIRLFQQTQAQLREIRLFRRLTDEANVGILTRGVSGLIEYANPAAARLFQFGSPQAMEGVSMRALYADDATYEADQQLCIQTIYEGGWSGETTQVRQDGKFITVDMSLFPIFTPEGSYITYGTFLQDATARREAMDAIAKANARFQAILEATTDGFIVWDENWRVILANPAAAEILGATMSALLGYDRALGDQLLVPALHTLMQAEESRRVEIPGGRIVSCVHLPWHLESSSGHLTVIYDETSQVELEKAREDTIAMLVHDLRSPLSIVVGGLDAAITTISETTPEHDALRFLAMVQRGSRRILDITNALLDIGKLESGQMVLECEPLTVSTLFEDVALDMEHTATTNNVTIRTSVEPNIPQIRVDHGLVRRAVSNLVDNALKFAPKGSVVELIATHDGEAGVRLTVADQGPGVPEEYRRTIFEKYQQVPGRRHARKGTGLGLAFCRLVAEAHNGKIWVDSRPEGGSLFHLVLEGCLPAKKSDSVQVTA